MPITNHPLRHAMIDHGMTNRDLAEAVGASPATISRIINRHNYPQRRLQVAISDVLGIPAEELFDDEKRQE